jgi:predicted small secreted protein
MLERLARTAAALAFLAAIALTAAACSTVEGAGEDLQYASEQTAEALNGDD